MRAQERFEYRGYVIGVLAEHQESGQWNGSYMILKEGDQISPGSDNQIGSYETIEATQDHAIKEARKTIDSLIVKAARIS